MSSSPAPLTWLQAAEYVLREEGPEMHIKDLTTRILELGIVKSNCATSLETLLYRQTSGGSQGRGMSRGVTGPSKFIRVVGKHGWFGLKPSVVQEESDLNISLESVEDILDDKNNSLQDFEVEPKFIQLKRRNSTHSSDEENPFFMMQSDSSESSDSSSDSGEGSSEEDMEPLLDESLYRKKYVFLKKMAKSIIFENAALSDQLTGMDVRIHKMELEREFLFRKLVQFEHVGVPKRCVAGVQPYSGFLLKNQPNPPATPQGPGEASKPLPKPHPDSTRTHAQNNDEKRIRRVGRQSQMTSQAKRAKMAPHHTERQQRGGLLLGNSDHSSGEWSESDGELVIDTQGTTAPSVPHSKKEVGKKKKEGGVSKKGVGPVAEEEGVGEGGDDEELELAMRSGKVRRLHPIPLNKDGSPVFPIVVGGLKVLDLGKIIWDRVAYHSERYLLPVGFESQRCYPSMLDPSRKCQYTCRILDGGETPLFEMVADDDLEHPVRATSSTACQTIVLKNINKARDKQATNSGSGPEFFGYSNPTILNLLQKMPDAKKCPKYKFVRFAEPSRRGGHKIGVQRLNPKSKALLQKAKGKKGVVPAKKKLKSEVRASKGSAVPPRIDSSSAIAPVFGTGLEQYGMDIAALSDSSSDDSSSVTDSELIIDS